MRVRSYNIVSDINYLDRSPCAITESPPLPLIASVVIIIIIMATSYMLLVYV